MTDADLEQERTQARLARAKTSRETSQTVRVRETELIPLRDRIKFVQQLDPWGDDLQISMTRRRPA